MALATLFCQWCSRSEYQRNDCSACDCGPWVSLEALRRRNPKAYQMVIEREKLRAVLGDALKRVRPDQTDTSKQ